MDNKDFLEHFGIPGMRWGVHRSHGGGSSKSRKKSSHPASEDYTISRKLKEKGSKNLSTKELKDLTQRLQLEKQLKDLSPKKYKKGLDVVKAITAAGTTVASLYALSKTPMAEDIKKAVTKAMEVKSEADLVKWVL
jgi:hypothetical protein